jgi:dienelactone hydrolase
MVAMLKHGKEQTRPSLDKVIAVLKEESVTKFGATAYCFGGRYTFDLAFDNVIQCIVVSHPSLFTVPDDLKVTHTVRHSVSPVFLVLLFQITGTSLDQLL